MRRILRKIATDQTADIGDTSTLADPVVVDKIIEGYKTLKAQQTATTSVPKSA